MEEEMASFREQRFTVAAALHCIVEMEKKESMFAFFSLFFLSLYRAARQPLVFL
jgi:hypothetical protein